MLANEYAFIEVHVQAIMYTSEIAFLEIAFKKTVFKTLKNPNLQRNINTQDMNEVIFYSYCKVCTS